MVREPWKSMSKPIDAHPAPARSEDKRKTSPRHEVSPCWTMATGAVVEPTGVVVGIVSQKRTVAATGVAGGLTLKTSACGNPGIGGHRVGFELRARLLGSVMSRVSQVASPAGL